MKVAPRADRNRGNTAIIWPTTGWLLVPKTRVPEMGFWNGPGNPNFSGFSVGRAYA